MRDPQFVVDNYEILDPYKLDGYSEDEAMDLICFPRYIQDNVNELRGELIMWGLEETDDPIPALAYIGRIQFWLAELEKHGTKFNPIVMHNQTRLVTTVIEKGRHRLVRAKVDIEFTPLQEDELNGMYGVHLEEDQFDRMEFLEMLKYAKVAVDVKETLDNLFD